MANRYVNPVPQYLTDATDVVPNGRLYIFESGTNDTNKPVFADENESVPAPTETDGGGQIYYPLTSSGRVPNLFYSGSAHVILTDGDENVIWDRDPVVTGSAGTGFADWAAGTEYSIGDIVYGSDQNLYRSLSNGNIGNDPTTTPTVWEQVDFIRTWNSSVTYDANDLVKASDGNLYSSLVGSNTGNNPISSPAQWKQSFEVPLGEAVNDLGNVSGATNIDLDLGNYFRATMTASATLTLTNPPADLTARTILLEIADGDVNAYTLALSGGAVEYDGGLAAIPSADDIVSIVISDGVTAKASFNQGYA